MAPADRRLVSVPCGVLHQREQPDDVGDRIDRGLGSVAEVDPFRLHVGHERIQRCIDSLVPELEVCGQRELGLDEAEIGVFRLVWKPIRIDQPQPILGNEYLCPVAKFVQRDPVFRVRRLNILRLVPLDPDQEAGDPESSLCIARAAFDGIFGRKILEYAELTSF
jgi:hypothetical protein